MTEHDHDHDDHDHDEHEHHHHDGPHDYVGAVQGYRAVIANVRPTWKERYPLIPIERYVRWTRDDGLPFDPWMRLHARLGARIVRSSPRALIVKGSVADWESWTGMAFPESGEYVVLHATQPVVIDRDRDEGIYYDQNVWMIHPID